MNAMIETIPLSIQNAHFAALFLDTLLKSFVVLALAGGICVLWRRGSAATRHLIWFLAVVSLPCLPLLTSMLPSWQRPLWSVSTGFNSGNQISLALELAPGTFVPRAPASPNAAEAPAASHNSTGGSRTIATSFSPNWMVLGLAAWFAGAALVLFSTVIGHFRLRRFSRNAQPLHDADWARLLEKAGATLRLRRTVMLLQSADDMMPLTWAWLRPVVLLPAEAAQWPEERRRMVLLHELAHIKRWDCLTQLVARIVCALYWFNPLVWLAARQMCVERERACDDLVLNGGCKASDYASHLVEIAKSFRPVSQVAAIAMARPSGLEKRIVAIVDGSRNRRLRWATATAILLVAGGIAVCLGESGRGIATGGMDEADPLRQQQLDRLKVFSTAKEKQSEILAAAAGETISPKHQRLFGAATNGDWHTVTNMAATGETISPVYQRLFGAAANGDWRTVTNMFESFKQRHPQYERRPGIPVDTNLNTSYWAPVLEICLAYDIVVLSDPKYTRIAADGIINSIPPGSIYFGGTDPGRALPTVFSKSQIDADPFYVLTQNALASGNYLDYLRSMYGGKIYTPTSEDAAKCFAEYKEDAKKRFQNHQLGPGEDGKTGTNGDFEIKGQVAVMMINGLLAKIIFDKNPDHEFYVEESFPLDWMYPYLEPHGLIMKINRQPQSTLSTDVLQRDHDYWAKLVAPMIGDWLHDDTSVGEIAAFAQKTFGKQDFTGFTGDPRFIQNAYSHRTFSKLRSSQAGVYAWRLKQAADAAEKERMARAADFAFRQAWALCPYSPEAVFRYVTFLLKQKRISDALVVAETAAQMPANQGKEGEQIRGLVEQLKKFQKAK